jgi:hypothetical protein
METTLLSTVVNKIQKARRRNHSSARYYRSNTSFRTRGIAVFCFLLNDVCLLLLLSGVTNLNVLHISQKKGRPAGLVTERAHKQLTMFVQADRCNAGCWTTEMATEVNSLHSDIVMLMYY